MTEYGSVFAVGLVLLIVFAPGLGAPATAKPGTDASSTFAVRQAGTCVTLEPLGDGTQNVSEFYDYRYPGGDPPGKYFSYGTRDIQLNDTSQLFVYRGTEGLSLVFLHDRVAGADKTSGGTVTADITGLPPGGEWAVEDDSYPHPDDAFEHNGTRSHIEWVWNIGNRTDGAAFRGLGLDGYDRIRIEMGFNQASDRYPWEEWRSPPEKNHLTSWVARSGDGTTHDLAMDEPVTVEPGRCDTQPPAVELSVTPDDPRAGEEVVLDAGNTTDDYDVREYRWDLDGDGTVDETTHRSRVNATFETTGRHAVAVTAVDAANNAATATRTVTVVPDPTTPTPTSTPTPTTRDDTPTPSTFTGPTTGGLDQPATSESPSVASEHGPFHVEFSLGTSAVLAVPLLATLLLAIHRS